MTQSNLKWVAGAATARGAACGVDRPACGRRPKTSASILLVAAITSATFSTSYAEGTSPGVSILGTWTAPRR